MIEPEYGFGHFRSAFNPQVFTTVGGRAAYWDGRNENGELVASGTYFYELSTPSSRQLRRMVIIK